MLNNTLSPAFVDYLGKLSYKTRSNTLAKNYGTIKQFAYRSLYIGSKGFKIGACVGGCLGFGLGCVQAYQMKKMWPIPVAMVGSGMVFGSMFAFSSVLKAESPK